MSIIETIFSFFGSNEKDRKRQQACAPPVSENTCSRHPLHQVAGKCRYCERDLCSDCLEPKNDFFICVDKVDCLGHMKKAEIVKAERVRKMFREFSERPNARIIGQLTDAVLDSKDPEITDAILESFGFECTNLGVYGLAIHCLGLVKDARALHRLTQCFDALSDQDALPQDPDLRAICADHLLRSAQAILDVVSGCGRANGGAIAAIKRIAECDCMPLDIRRRATNVFREETGQSIHC
ncbi:MAG: hypothetical protein PHI97_31125 [Desulfobulbus sp.]|nr:hypothetical protein [Desulfobulbus sp.]